jgi:hypothetical protein
MKNPIKNTNAILLIPVLLGLPLLFFYHFSKSIPLVQASTADALFSTYVIGYLGALSGWLFISVLLSIFQYWSLRLISKQPKEDIPNFANRLSSHVLYWLIPFTASYLSWTYIFYFHESSWGTGAPISVESLNKLFENTISAQVFAYENPYLIAISALIIGLAVNHIVISLCLWTMTNLDAKKSVSANIISTLFLTVLMIFLFVKLDKALDQGTSKSSVRAPISRSVTENTVPTSISIPAAEASTTPAIRDPGPSEHFTSLVSDSVIKDLLRKWEVLELSCGHQDDKKACTEQLAVEKELESRGICKKAQFNDLESPWEQCKSKNPS